MKKRIISSILLAIFLSFSFALRAYGLTQTYDTRNGYIVYTIDKGDGGGVTLDCNDVAATLMNQTSAPGDVGMAKIKIINNSKENYRFKEVVFYTENRVNRNVTGTQPMPPSEIARTTYPPDDGAINGAQGFDSKKIPYSMTPLRAINRPMKELYGVNNNWELSLLQVQNADEESRKKGYSSYGDYLLSYYNHRCSSHSNCKVATSLDQLHPLHLAEILGSGAYGFGGQTEIRLPRKITEKELLSGLYDDFRKYGWGSQIVLTDSKEYIVQQDFEIMETDMEVIKAGYRYLYEYGLYFTFNDLKYSLNDAVSDEITTNGLSVLSFIQKTNSAKENVNSTLKYFGIPSGRSNTLDHIAFGVQLPNAYDIRSIDFGFEIVLETGDIPIPPNPSPDPNPDPKPDPNPDPDPNLDPRPDPNPDPNLDLIDKDTPIGGNEPQTGGLGFYMVSAISVFSFFLMVGLGMVKKKIKKRVSYGNELKKVKNEKL